MVITISVFWYAGYDDKRAKDTKIQQYAEEIIKKQQALEKIAAKEATTSSDIAVDQLPERPIILTSMGTSSQQELYRNYGLAVAQALKPLSQNRDSEVKAVLNAIDKNDASYLRAVTISRSYHQQVADNLKNIAVPKELASYQFRIASQINLLVARLTNMEQALTQPTVALTNSQLFTTDDLAFIQSIQSLNQFFAANNVSFPDKEKIQIFVSFTK